MWHPKRFYASHALIRPLVAAAILSAALIPSRALAFVAIDAGIVHDVGVPWGRSTYGPVEVPTQEPETVDSFRNERRNMLDLAWWRIVFLFHTRALAEARCYTARACSVRSSGGFLWPRRDASRVRGLFVYDAC
jgi:hypothetical protein